VTDHHLTITPRGPFDLARSIAFLEDWPAAEQPPGQSALRFAFCPDHDWAPVGVTVTAEGSDVRVTTTAPATEALGEQVARILSLDVDATDVDDLAGRDPVVAGLMRSAPGSRPVCFWTPWEAACWAVLSQRTSRRTASMLKQRITRTHGTEITIGDETHFAFPSPSAVLESPGLPGVNPVKLEWIHGLAAAALAGTLTADTLRSHAPDEALALLRDLPGIGPFSASLVLIRGAGEPDAFTTSEPRLLQAVRTAYRLPESTTNPGYARLAEAWRPFRSWVAFWLRSASPHTLDAIAAQRDS
jgi:DNA-3-methyladenine glycosylase II